MFDRSTRLEKSKNKRLLFLKLLLLINIPTRISSNAQLIRVRIKIRSNLYDTIVLICSSDRIHPRRRVARAVRRPVQRTNNKGPVSSVNTHCRGRDHIFTSLFLTLRFCFVFFIIIIFFLHNSRKALLSSKIYVHPL